LMTRGPLGPPIGDPIIGAVCTGFYNNPCAGPCPAFGCFFRYRSTRWMRRHPKRSPT